jgi:uncharacterized membrane protein YfcA
MWAPEILVLVLAAFVVAGMVKGVVGLGLPTVSMALLTATLGLRDAMALMLVPSLATNIWQAVAGPYLREVLTRFWPMMIAALGGIYFGLKIGVGVAPHVLGGVLGVLLCIYSAAGMSRFSLAWMQKGECVWSPVMGLASGMMTGLAGVFIIPGALYLQALQLNKDLFVQTLGVLFVAATIGLGVGLSRHDLLGGDHALTSVLAVLPAFAGMYVGQRIRARLSESTFRTALFSALAGIGIYLIVRAFA